MYTVFMLEVFYFVDNCTVKTPEPSLDNDPSGVGVSGDQRSTTVTDDPREKLRRSTATSLVTRSNRDPPSKSSCKIIPVHTWTSMIQRCPFKIKKKTAKSDCSRHTKC